MANLLVIAPSADLRGSLAFAFEAEGYQVTSLSGLDEARPSPNEIDCTVLDHHAAEAATEAVAAFCATYRPVVLLVNFAPHPLSASVFRTVQKPLLGPTLSFAVKVAVSTTANPK